MQLHQLKPNHKRKKKKRIGRGGKRGTYCGRGLKGQKSRAGMKLQPIIRTIIKRYPKKRGYKFGILKPKPAIVNIASLEKHFKENTKISPRALFEKGLISKQKSKIPMVKVLGRGEIKKKLMIEDCQVSKSAQNKIEKAGGSVTKVTKDEYKS